MKNCCETHDGAIPGWTHRRSDRLDMTDAYSHLDLRAEDPIADLEMRLDSAGLDPAVVVETWRGGKLAVFHKLLERSNRFRIAFCWRPEQGKPPAAWFRNARVRALRVKTADLPKIDTWARDLQSAGKYLLRHAESGMDALAGALSPVLKQCPSLHVCLPHLGWP